eukprot:TRINITY_DN425_c0_g1_i1.p1 TRINITY_DN425_c0_g1~~TRINITY_DN425_c0_g1_i1.p1  ORF type:complete len:270 (-),score=62.38 TRINITY_DN425_c0_g1_i1:205-1014(-)
MQMHKIVSSSLFRGTAPLLSTKISTPFLHKATKLTSSFAQSARFYTTQINNDHSGINQWHGTTILAVRRDNKVVLIGDGQVSMGSTVVKGNAHKVRRLGSECIAGFAGSTADAITLFELLEERLEEHKGQLLRSCVELAKAWRTDKYLRKLDAIMIVADKNVTLTLTGNGDVLDTVDGVVGVGSGGQYALSAARALLTVPGIDAEEVAKRAMNIASEICIYTNSNYSMESISVDPATGQATITTLLPKPSSTTSSSSSILTPPSDTHTK